MFNKDKKSNFHPWYNFIFTIIILFSLLLIKNNGTRVFLFILISIVYFYCGMRIVAFLKNSLRSLLFASVFFVLTLLNPNPNLLHSQISHWGPLTFSDEILFIGFSNLIKLTLLMTISMSSLLVIDYSHLVLYLISEKKLSVHFGYPLLLALNSISLFKKEFQRINIMAISRGLSFYERSMMLFPLLVFAVRHAERGSMSLVTRGIHSERTFYYNYGVTKKDNFLMFFFGCLFLLILALTFFIR